MPALKKIQSCFRLLILGVILVGISGCGNEKRPELKILSEPPYPPFEYYVNDKLTGVDIDLIKEIARRLGYEPKIQTISFDLIIKSVEAGQADVGISSISITPERKKHVDFSLPYINISQVVIVPLKSSIRRPENLKGKMIGVQESTTGEEYVKKMYGPPVPFPNIEVAADALAGGKIDALVLDNITAEFLVAQNRYFRQLPEKMTEESYGIAINKKKPDLVKKINKVLGELLKDGWIERKIKEHTAVCKGEKQYAVPDDQVLKIGIVPSYPPYESKEKGVLVGIDVDIINSICDELGLYPSFIEINSDTIYQSIAEDDITLSISSISITEERKKMVDFSIPYSEASQRILVKNKSAFRTKNDLKGKTIGVVTGTTSEEQGRLLSTEIESYSEPKLILDALAKGEVDAIVLDDFILKQLTMHSKGFRLLPDILTKEEYGIAVSKKRPELLKKINQLLLKMKRDGSLAKIHDKYLSKQLQPSK